MNHRFMAIIGSALALVALLAAGASAETTGTEKVGLVIRYPDGDKHLEIVTVPDDATTFELLQAASIDLISEDSGYGPAVCAIDNAGCPVAGNCFCDLTHYWAYYHLSADGKAWQVASTGVGFYDPADHAVEGFAWSGFDADFNPTVQPPLYTFDEIVAATSPEPVAVPEPGTLALLGAGLAGLTGYVWRIRVRQHSP